MLKLVLINNWENSINVQIYDKLITANGNPNPFALNLLRDIIIPDILQEDTSSISYWAGKNLARKYPTSTGEPLVAFCLNAGFGNLTKITEQGTLQKWQLSGPLVENRFTATNNNPDFNLEAGFLAQQIEQFNDIAAEANFQTDVKNKIVTIKIQTEKR